MDMSRRQSDGTVSEPVTVWHYLAEGEGGVLYHVTRYDAAVTHAEHAAEVRMQRHGVAELQGFLFPDGHSIPITPAVGRDVIACGDWTAYEDPQAAQAHGAEIYSFSEVIRPPRLSGGTMVEWVQFTANALV